MPPLKKSDNWVISPKTQRLIKVGGPAYEALSPSQKANAKKASKKKKLKKPIKKSKSFTTKGTRAMSLMMVASRDGNFSREKFRRKVSSEEGVKARMIDLSTKGWMVKAAAFHGLPEKLWESKNLSDEDLSDWVCGYTIIKKSKEVYKTYKVKITLKPIKTEIEERSSKKVTRKIPVKRPIKKGMMVKIKNDLRSAARYEVQKIRGNEALVLHDPSGESDWVEIDDLIPVDITLKQYQEKVRAKLGGGGW